MEFFGTPLDAGLYHIWFRYQGITRKELKYTLSAIMGFDIGKPRTGYTRDYIIKVSNSIATCFNLVDKHLKFYPSERSFVMKPPVSNRPSSVTTKFKYYVDPALQKAVNFLYTPSRREECINIYNNMVAQAEAET